jgi:hypothetical protein
MVVVNTGIKATGKRLSILGSVIGQMSDGIWENTRSMERYWKSLDYRETNGEIYLEDHNFVCNDVRKFFADKIKQIIKIEIEDGHTRLDWSRTCSEMPSYFRGGVTVGDCYELYELLKGRNTDKYSYSTYSDYTVKVELGSTSIDVVVNALNEAGAKKAAVAKVLEQIKTTVVKA